MSRDRSEELALGRRYRAAYLVEQATTTEKLAKADAALLAPLGIGKPVFDTLADLTSKLDAARKDKTLAETEAHFATSIQNEAFAKAKNWLRKAILIGKNAYDGEATAREFEKGGTTGTSVPKLRTKVGDVLVLLRKDETLAAKHGASKEFLKTGDELKAALTDADSSQEAKKLVIPKTTEDFLLQKAHLYLLLKRINRAGQAALVDDPVRAAAYNLSILYRRGMKKAKEEAKAGTGGEVKS